MAGTFLAFFALFAEFPAELTKWLTNFDKPYNMVLKTIFSGSKNIARKDTFIMVCIVSDTSTLYSTAEARQAGFAVAPLSVTADGRTWREFDEISSREFVELVRQGHLPTSSQPAVGEVAELYGAASGEVVNITMADGLSGTYASAVAAAELCGEGTRVTVLNSRTLCGPHRYLVENAVAMAREGKTAEEIVEKTEELMDTAKSYLLPADFDFLRRGGRLSPLTAHIGHMAHLAPIMTQTADGRQLTAASVRRGYANAVKYVGKALWERGVGPGWRVYVTHADAEEKAEQAVRLLREALPGADFAVLPLSPVFIAQGGPDCVAIQVIREA